MLIRFEIYLREVKGLADSTIRSRTANCGRLAQYEGDLDGHFDRDGMEELLARLTYSTDTAVPLTWGDKRLGSPCAV